MYGSMQLLCMSGQPCHIVLHCYFNAFNGGRTIGDCTYIHMITRHQFMKPMDGPSVGTVSCTLVCSIRCGLHKSTSNCVMCLSFVQLSLLMRASWNASTLMNIQGWGGLQQICLLQQNRLLAVTDGGGSL